MVRLTSATGALAYAGRAGGPSRDSAVGVAIDPDDGAAYVAGSFLGRADLNLGRGRAYFDGHREAAFLTALAPDMSFRWARTHADAKFSLQAQRLAVAHGGNAYVAGIDADHEASDWLWGINRAGKTLFARPAWAPEVGSSLRASERGLAAGPDGRLYSAGEFSRTMDFDPGRGEVLRTASGRTDAYILELDAMGHYVNVSVIGGRGSQAGWALAVGMGGKVFAAGSFVGPTDFNPGRGVLFRTTPEGDSRVWILRLNQ